MQSERPFDVALWGATGFTGKLVAERLLVMKQTQGLTFALAGRNRDKLEAVRTSLGDAAKELPVIVASVDDEASMRAMASQAAVVCSTAGPYALHGLPVVRAAVHEGADYCDITGEVTFMRRSIDEFHELAQQKGVRAVHGCGFDSIPSDLGVLTVHEHFRRAHDSRLGHAQFFMGESKGGGSGGTAASMLNLLAEASQNKEVRRLLLDPYGLNPKGARGPDGRDTIGVRKVHELGLYAGPFVMGSVNTRVVRRTNALMGYPYGKDFTYSEEMTFGRGPKGFALASGVAAGMAAVMAAGSARTGRTLLERVLPAPGEGPSKAQRDSGHFTARILAEGTSAPGARKQRVLGIVKGTNDPGYGETSKMLSVTCMMLVKTRGQGRAAGVLTPASALGMDLVTALVDAGMTFSAQDHDGQG
jgi:short subunit dehydrogenase-like uncharacterized protein